MFYIKYLTIGLLAAGMHAYAGSVTYSVTDQWVDADLGPQAATVAISVPDFIQGPTTLECACGSAGNLLTLLDNLYVSGFRLNPTSDGTTATILLRDRTNDTPGFYMTSAFDVPANTAGTFVTNTFVTSNLEGLSLLAGRNTSAILSTLTINPEPSSLGLGGLGIFFCVLLAFGHRKMDRTDKKLAA